jgi:galactose mutarotase-like enzyme
MGMPRDFDGEPAYLLRDDAGATAWVLPGIGANCIAFQVPVAGQAVHLLSTPPTAAALRGHPTGWGFPILSPYPGRNRAPFTWLGRTYDVRSGDQPGTLMHGFVAGASWEVVEATDDRLTCRFDSETISARATRWPWPFTLTATHRVEDGALTLELALDNRADEPVPHMLGLHPYFPIRLTAAAAAPSSRTGELPTAAALAGAAPAAAATRETCQVWVAADELWETAGGMATGTIRRLEGAWDLRRPQPLDELERRLGEPAQPSASPTGAGVAGAGAGGHAAGGRRLPVLMYGKRAALRAFLARTDPAADGGVYSGLRDTTSAVEVTLATSAAFGTLALYCPPGQPHLSLEPRTAMPDALSLLDDPRRLSVGLWPLDPGQRWHAWARISAGALRPDLSPGARVRQ